MCRAFAVTELVNDSMRYTGAEFTGDLTTTFSNCNKNIRSLKTSINYFTIARKTIELYNKLQSTDKNIEDSVNQFFDSLIPLFDGSAEEFKLLLVNICYNVYMIFCDLSGSEGNILDLDDMFEGIYNKDKKYESIMSAKEAVILTYEAAFEKKKHRYSKTVQTVFDYLNKNYDQKLTLSKLSEEFEISSSHLCRLIKKETGKTFIDLFNSIKIKHAERLLKETNMKVYEVALAVGIDNYAYFYQIYKKLMGKSPTAT